MEDTINTKKIEKYKMHMTNVMKCKKYDLKDRKRI